MSGPHPCKCACAIAFRHLTYWVLANRLAKVRCLPNWLASMQPRVMSANIVSGSYEPQMLLHIP